jgi:isopenicillin N synthase-like dioxygenase
MEQHGFIAISAHGVTADFLESVFRHSQNVLSANPETMGRYTRDDRQRGYCPNGTEQAVGATVADDKIFWMTRDPQMPENESDAPFGPNIWPEEMEYAAFQHWSLQLLQEQLRIGRAVLRGIEIGYNFQPGFLTDMTVGAESIQRPIYYPPIVGELPPGTMRSAPHEDINLLTVLFTERNAAGSDGKPDGLELFLDGTWKPVDVDQNSCVINIGEMIAAIEGLRHLKPTTHRVVMPTGEAAGRARMSIPLFMHARRSVELREGLYAGAWIDQRLAEITKRA